MKFHNSHYLGLIVGLLLAFTQLHGQLGIELAETLRENVVKISTDLKNGDDLDGFGFITGERGNKVYVLTAVHVVKGDGMSGTADKIEVEFYKDKRTFPGLVITEEHEHDVAVLEVDKPDFLKWKKDCIDDAAKEYEVVRFIGINTNWKIIDKGVINEIRGNKIMAQINVLPGTSGAPLLSDRGIVGMIIEDDIGSETTVVQIEKIEEIVTEDGRFDYMFLLTPNPLTPEQGSGVPPGPLDILNKAMMQLNSPSNMERLAAISTFRLYALTDPDLTKGKTIVAILVDFIKNNLPNRKQNGEGITYDRGTFRADDISSALETLQEIRKANNNNIDIDLNSLNFDNVNLTGLDLSGFNLDFCSFKHAFLSGTKYLGTRFNFANFQESASWNSDFTGASFDQAKFYLAKFVNPVLVQTNIERGADLRFALFRPIGLTAQQEAILSKHTTISK